MKRILVLMFALPCLMGCADGDTSRSKSVYRSATPTHASATSNTTDLFGLQIAEVSESFGNSIVYVRIDSKEAQLPWTVTKDSITVVTSKGARMPMAGVCVTGQLGFSHPVTFNRSDDERGFAYVLADGRDGDGPIELLMVDRPLKSDEIAFIFTAPELTINSLEVRLQEDKVVTLPAPKQQVD